MRSSPSGPDATSPRSRSRPATAASRASSLEPPISMNIHSEHHHVTVAGTAAALGHDGDEGGSNSNSNSKGPKDTPADRAERSADMASGETPRRSGPSAVMGGTMNDTVMLSLQQNVQETGIVEGVWWVNRLTDCSSLITPAAMSVVPVIH